MIYKTATKILELDNKKAIVSVVGCGGKTTFIKSLAKELALKHVKILVTTTTKIHPWVDRDVVLCSSLEECRNIEVVPGIYCFGIENAKTGKLESLPTEFLEKIVCNFDFVLIEADGSAGLPCKGWLEYEPVVSGFSTHTVGIVTMNAIGKRVDESRVLRLDEFGEITGLRRGDLIDDDALMLMITNKNGMFKKSVGKKCLFITQIESEEKAEKAEIFAKKLAEKQNLKFDDIAYGSGEKNRWIKIK